MTAKEMFEKLGYVKYKNEYDKEAETIWGKDCVFRYINKKLGFEILFDNIDEDYCVYSDICPNVAIGIKLHQAINKQVEELGWNK
jgi:hypothetical protein